MIDVVRKTCNAGAQTVFAFKAASTSCCVKNFTSAPILVCLGTWDESQSVKIQSGMWERIRSNPDPAKLMTRSAASTVIVQAEVAGEVEVQRDD